MELSAILLFMLIGIPNNDVFSQPVADPISYFPENYTEARENFLKAARRASAGLEHYENPHRGPGGERLFVDVALLGPADAANVLVVISGTHGVEGSCGSGIQTGLLINNLTSRLPADTRAVFIHALNPYGMAWLRRVNEDNVDLNRNFVDHNLPPDNTAYEVLANVIAPAEYTDEVVQQARVRLLAYAKEAAARELHRLAVDQPDENQVAYAAKVGQRQLQAAISRGQYTHEQGIHFGGKSKIWSNRTLHEIVSKHILATPRVVLVDLHTGLGPYGHGECIMNESINSDAYTRARKWWGNTVKSTTAGESSSPDITGSLKYAFARMFGPNTEVTAISLEFGTYDPPEVFFAMQAENWMHNHGKKDDPRAGQIKSEMRRVFYPDSDHWKRMVWARANYVVDQALVNMIGEPQ